MTINQGTLTTEEEPFQVVLIDMKKAAAQGEIHCVEKPLLGSGDLKFVAISYRWGELNETLMETGLGYVASISSFALNTLIVLCKTMAQERDLKDMDYVWVDAICVDQTNVERRKVTIYHMTDIYQRANYIVAVPDLHLEHLWTGNDIHKHAIGINESNAAYIYHLIQGNVAQLEAYDQQFLDECCVPKDPRLRHLLTSYTNHFVKGFTQCRYDDFLLYEAEVLQHLLSPQSSVKHQHPPPPHQGKPSWHAKPSMDLDKLTIDELHTCHPMKTCPLKIHPSNDDTTLNESKKVLIPNRSRDLRLGMAWLKGLVEDWSIRAWVVSEYHIAKTKPSNKMKYWFMQLESLSPDPKHFNLDEYLFFEFDFNDNGSSSQQDGCVALHSGDAVYQVFHAAMKKQLNQQSFLEKMLKTKASKNVDRFHAILPSSEYKHILTSKEQVDSWHITSLASVKLQLYEWMTPRHKLVLLFLSACNDAVDVLPTFATTTIRWPSYGEYPLQNQAEEDDEGQCNFDLTSSDDDDAITFIKKKGSPYKLTLKPLGYYRHENYHHVTIYDLQLSDKEVATMRRLLGLGLDATLDFVCIPDMVHKRDGSYCVFLLGSFTENKWILKCNPSISHDMDGYEGWHHHALDKSASGFDIY